MPLTFGELHHFNTGRLYSANRQPIIWATFTDGAQSGVVFMDKGRGITKCIPLPGQPGICTYQGQDTPQTYHGALTDAYVLHLYDSYIELPDSYDVHYPFEKFVAQSTK